MYLSIANHLGLHISEPLYKKNSGPLGLPVSMVVLRRAQIVGLGPHLSHLIYIYESKINKYTLVCTWSSAPYTVTETLLYIIKGPMVVISGLLPETRGYFCMKNFMIHYMKLSFTYSRKHTFYFVCLAQGTPSFFFSFGLWAP